MTEYKVIFDVKGLNEKSRRDRELRNILIERFVKLRSKVIEEINPNYEDWNKEFELIHGKISDVDQETYFNFIAEKQDEILKKYDEEDFKIRSYPEDNCDLIGFYDYRHTHVRIEAFCVPM